MRKKKQSTHIKMSGSRIAFNIFAYVFILLIALFCMLPFLMLISASLSSERSISLYGYSVLPRQFTTEAYKLLFKYPQTIIRAYGVSILITVTGTFTSLLLTSMAGYVLSRRDFKYRNRFSFFFYFTTLFNGGLVSTYIFTIRYLHLKDNLLAVILPLLINVFYLLIMRSFMQSIPVELIESAKVDGAGDFFIYRKIIMPLSKAGLATIGLFIALGYWNDWYHSMLFISDRTKWPLQYMLYDMLNTAQAMSNLSTQANISMGDLPSQSMRMAMAVIATGPALLLYPFVQKYFVKGVTVGAVKG